MAPSSSAHPQQHTLDHLRTALTMINLDVPMPAGGVGVAPVTANGVLFHVQPSQVGCYRWTLEGAGVRGAILRGPDTITLDSGSIDPGDGHDLDAIQDQVSAAFASLDPALLDATDLAMARHLHREALFILSVRVTDCLTALSDLNQAHQLAAATSLTDSDQRRLAQQLSRQGFQGTADDLLDASASALREQAP